VRLLIFRRHHLLFGTGTPLGRVHGYGIRKTIRAIEELDIPAADKEKIFEAQCFESAKDYNIESK